MSGTRDTEMAIGAWQPMYTVNENADPDTEGIGCGPFGDIHAFRMSLWTEHFRYWDPLFRFPEQLECTQKVRNVNIKLLNVLIYFLCVARRKISWNYLFFE